MFAHYQREVKFDDDETIICLHHKKGYSYKAKRIWVGYTRTRPILQAFINLILRKHQKKV